MHKRTVKFIALILFMIAAIFFALSMDLRHILNPSTIQEFVNQFQILGPVVFILLYMVGQVLLIPATPLSIVAGVIFGAFQGSIYAIVGATLGSIVAFSIAPLCISQYELTSVPPPAIPSLRGHFDLIFIFMSFFLT